MILKQDGSVWTCGLNANGQLGIESVRFASNTFEAAILTGVKAIAAGPSHSIVLKQDDSVWTTGSQLRSNDIRQFQPLEFIEGGKAVAAGIHHSVVLTQRGSVWATGWNRFGQLGDNTNIDKASFQMVISTNAKAVTTGHVHSMVLKVDGSVWAAGWNRNGQLGDGTTTSRNYFAQVMDSGAKAVAAGGYHSMVLKQDGTVWATGWNMYGQLGICTEADWTDYHEVAKSVQAVAVGTRHSVVLKQDGSVWTTGYNLQEKDRSVVDGSTNRQCEFIMVISGGAEAVTAGGYHSMVRYRDDTVWAVGSNRYGQLGYGEEQDAVQKFVRVVQVMNGAVRNSPSKCPFSPHIQTQT